LSSRAEFTTSQSNVQTISYPLICGDPENPKACGEIAEAMSVPADLLTQARSLATSDPKKPKQANLRRAVSSAYYALFHFLSEEAARSFVGAGPQDRVRRDLARRAVAHTRLKDVCQEFLKPTPRIC
jgi:hypothetical protein